MNTGTAYVSYRPVRLGWCVRENNWDDLRRAIRLTTTLWGGRFNPIIPVGRNGALAESLVRLFGVDALFPLADDNVLKDFVASFTWLPWPNFEQSLFIGDDAAFLDIYHPARHLFEQRLKDNSDPTFHLTQFEWNADDPLADLFLSYFGTYPSKDETPRDYDSLVREGLRSQTIKLSPIDEFFELHLRAYTPLRLTRYVLEWHSAPDHANRGIYVGHVNNFEDITNFWNLRAADIELVFYDKTHGKRLEQMKNAFLEEHNDIFPTEGRRFDHAVALWARPEELKDTLPAEIATTPNSKKLDYVMCAITLDTWNDKNVKPSRFNIETPLKSILDTIADDPPVLSFRLPDPPFFPEIEFHHQNAVVRLSNISHYAPDSEDTFETPCVAELNPFYGAKLYYSRRAVRVEPEGIGIITSLTTSNLHIHSLLKRDLIFEIFKLCGMTLELSQPGRIASRLIHQMGGIQGCRVFKIPGVRDLIESVGPQEAFTRTNAICRIGRNDPVTGLPNFGEYENLYVERRDRGPLKPEHAFVFLLKTGVFQVGLSLTCDQCELEFWTPLDELRTDTKCEYCGKHFPITPQLKDRDWRFRRSGLFGKDNHQEGSIPVVVTLQQLDTIHNNGMFITNANINPINAAIEPCETDFVYLHSPTKWWDRRVAIAIGECKTRGGISQDDVRKLGAVADDLDKRGFKTFVLFAKLAPFTPEDVEICRTAQNRRKDRVIMLSDRELEPYFVFERTEKVLELRSSSAIDLHDLAETTNDVYFNPRPKVHG